MGGAINDDHLPLLKAGIPAIDIIESAHPETGSFPPVWHTMSDNLDNVDATTMGIVGQVLAQLIYSEQ
jgi:Zn-dependent M28 family amino/carboxypeptidase